MKSHSAYISVGSNLGNRLENCRRGIEKMAAGGTCRIDKQSGIYRTEPVDYTDQDWFVNFVVKIATALEPFQLLERLQSIQRDAGRRRDPIRFGPRLLDLDIILFDELVINSSRLVVPHPRMHKRRFVLKPLCDIDPSIIHPVYGENMQTLLDRLEENGQRVVHYQ